MCVKVYLELCTVVAQMRFEALDKSLTGLLSHISQHYANQTLINVIKVEIPSKQLIV